MEAVVAGAVGLGAAAVVGAVGAAEVVGVKAVGSTATGWATLGAPLEAPKQVVVRGEEAQVEGPLTLTTGPLRRACCNRRAHCNRKARPIQVGLAGRTWRSARSPRLQTSVGPPSQISRAVEGHAVSCEEHTSPRRAKRARPTRRGAPGVLALSCFLCWHRPAASACVLRFSPKKLSEPEGGLFLSYACVRVRRRMRARAPDTGGLRGQHTPACIRQSAISPPTLPKPIEQRAAF